MKKTFEVIKTVLTWLIVLLAVCMMVFTIVSVTTFDRNDRALFGYVTDMFMTTFITFPVFNVADICVVLGGIATVVYVLFFYDKLEKKGNV